MSKAAGDKQRWPYQFVDLVDRATKWIVSGATIAVLLWSMPSRSGGDDSPVLQSSGSAIKGTTSLPPRAYAVPYAVLGAIVNALLTKVLKRLLAVRRPKGARRQNVSHGMPSSHASSIAFLATAAGYGAVCMLDDPSLAPPPIMRSIVVPFVALAGGATLSSLRVLQGHHTVAQIAVGFVQGWSVCAIWLLGGRGRWGLVPPRPSTDGESMLLLPGRLVLLGSRGMASWCEASPTHPTIVDGWPALRQHCRLLFLVVAVAATAWQLPKWVREEA